MALERGGEQGSNKTNKKLANHGRWTEGGATTRARTADNEYGSKESNKKMSLGTIEMKEVMEMKAEPKKAFYLKFVRGRSSESFGN